MAEISSARDTALTRIVDQHFEVYREFRDAQKEEFFDPLLAAIGRERVAFSDVDTAYIDYLEFHGLAADDYVRVIQARARSADQAQLVDLTKVYAEYIWRLKRSTSLRSLRKKL